MSIPEAGLKKNGARFISVSNSAVYDGNAKDVSRGRQVIDFVRIGSGIGSHEGEGATAKGK